MKYHALFVILKKRQNLKLSSAANYRWRFLGNLNKVPAVYQMESIKEVP